MLSSNSKRKITGLKSKSYFYKIWIKVSFTKLLHCMLFIKYLILNNLANSYAVSEMLHFTILLYRIPQISLQIEDRFHLGLHDNSWNNNNKKRFNHVKTQWNKLWN